MERSVSKPMSHPIVPRHDARPSRRHFYNPFNADDPSDPVIKTTDRHINRLIAVAAEAGAKCALAVCANDPLVWMYSPSHRFDGEAPFMACVRLEHFRSAISRQCFTLDDRPTADIFPATEEGRCGSGGGKRPTHCQPGTKSRRLYTATVVNAVGSHCTHSFHAIVADGPGEVAARLRQRCGTNIARKAIIRTGFDPSEPLAVALVSDAVADMLLLIDAEPASSLGDGLEVQIETRFEQTT